MYSCFVLTDDSVLEEVLMEMDILGLKLFQLNLSVYRKTLAQDDIQIDIMCIGSRL